MSDFINHVLAVLRIPFPSAAHGGEYSSLSGDIEGLPLRVDVSEFDNYPSLFRLIPESAERGAAVGDDRPVLLVTRKKGADPLVVATLSDFCLFCEKNLYVPDVVVGGDHCLEEDE